MLKVGFGNIPVDVEALVQMQMALQKCWLEVDPEGNSIASEILPLGLSLLTRAITRWQCTHNTRLRSLHEIAGGAGLKELNFE